MEIKINKEIKDFNETMFFGLSVRQFIFAILALITFSAGIPLYFTKPKIINGTAPIIQNHESSSVPKRLSRRGYARRL